MRSMVRRLIHEQQPMPRDAVVGPGYPPVIRREEDVGEHLPVPDSTTIATAPVSTP